MWKERDKLGFCPFKYARKIQLEDGELLALTETAPKLSLQFGLRGCLVAFSGAVHKKKLSRRIWADYRN